jgi:hypothetical protein
MSALVFYDWEFYENGRTIEPISLGMVCQDGRELYLVNVDFDWDNCPSEWLHKNVKPQLMAGFLDKYLIRQCHRNWIGEAILDWLIPEIEHFGSIKLVGDYVAYDHVLLVQQFGTMMDLPEGIPMYSHDLRQWIDDLGNPQDLPRQSVGEHNALFDARYICRVYGWLKKNYKHPAWDSIE